MCILHEYQDPSFIQIRLCTTNMDTLMVKLQQKFQATYYCMHIYTYPAISFHTPAAAMYILSSKGLSNASNCAVTDI